jgi:hypothetical protein
VFVGVGVFVGGTGVLVGVFVRVGVLVAVFVAVLVAVFVGVGVFVGGTGVLVGVFVRVGVLVGGIGVLVGVFVRVGVLVAVFVGVFVGTGVLVGVNVGVLVGTGVLVGVLVRVGVLVAVAVGVLVRVGVAVGVLVGNNAGRSARMSALPTSACALAVAVFAPVAPETACMAKLPSIDSPATFGTASVARSNASVMPAGDVQVAELPNAYDVTSIALDTVVVTLGDECDRPLAVLAPASTSMGVTLSTPMNVWMPPAAPVFAEIVHV